jgi:hypothetical protein
MKWLDKKVRFICNQLSDFIEKFSKDFDALHFVTQIIITSPIWITLLILIIKASRGDFDG